MEYLIILSTLFLFAVFLEWKFRIHLYQSRKERFVISFIFFLIGLSWDWWSTSRGHWIFDFDKLMGIKIGILPVEEYLFFLIVPYVILTFYKVLKRKV